MSELDQAKNQNAGSVSRTASKAVSPVSVRVSPHSYFVAVFLGTFLAAFLFYLEMEEAGWAAFVIAWFVVPFLALRDTISFDGKALRRTGVVPKLWQWFNGGRRRLRLIDIEQVETHALRTWRRGGTVHYRFRTSLRGRGVSVVFASGGESFRQMIGAILPRLPEDALDIRSLDLRSYLGDPREVVMKAESARIPSDEMLEREFRRNGVMRSETARATEEVGRAEHLRELGNELRTTGHTARGLEAFRQALRIHTPSGRLLFDFARCLHSFAGAQRDPRAERRSLAALRLSELRAGDDGELVARIGEAFHQFGEFRQAERAFKRAIETASGRFRAAKGLAEIALNEGKIAHVIHHFAAANRAADTASLRRWAKAEADYFSNLNSDEEYMETEIHRVQLFESMERSKWIALRIAFLSFPFVTVGLLFGDALVTNIGWAVSGVSLLIWAGLVVTGQLVSRRIPYELMPDDED